MKTPVCYTFRRCPYAIRARMTLDCAGIEPEYREIRFSDKPPQMLTVSPKGTVPVLVHDGDKVLEESWDIMRWALAQNDPESWLPDSPEAAKAVDDLVHTNDHRFKEFLDRYKYADRHPELTPGQHREQALWFLEELESLLADGGWLGGHRMAVADVAVFPFIRQFSMVEPQWFEHSPFHRIRDWLTRILESPRFARVMVKRDLWDHRRAA